MRKIYACFWRRTVIWRRHFSFSERSYQPSLDRPVLKPLELKMDIRFSLDISITPIQCIQCIHFPIIDLI
jgi:hypothetical protein